MNEAQREAETENDLLRKSLGELQQQVSSLIGLPHSREGVLHCLCVCVLRESMRLDQGLGATAAPGLCFGYC